MKRFTCLVLMTVLLMTGLACGEGIYTERAEAGIEADRLLEKNYGIVQEMLTYFTRHTEKTDQGYVVTYSGSEAFYDVLGTYTVRPGGNPEVEWSLDGRDTSGMFDAEVWGREQLEEMVRQTSQTRSISEFWTRAMEITTQHGAEVKDVKSADIDMEDAEYIEEAIPEDVLAVMKQAVREQYGLSEDQLARMSVTMAYENDREILGYLWLAQDEEVWTEKDGQYTVAVLKDGNLVDYMEYDAALSGNG